MDGAAATRVAAYWGISAGTLGLQYAYGLLLVDLIAEFSSSRALVAAVGSAGTAVMELTSALGGWLIAQRGERIVCFTGAVCAGIGLATSASATALWQLFLTYSLLTGVGHSLALISGVVMCNRYFEKRRSLAQAIANTGAGVGPFVLGLTWSQLRDRLGWRSTLQLLGAADFVLLCACAAVLTRPGLPLVPAGCLARGKQQGAEGAESSGGGAERPVPWSTLLSRRPLRPILAAACLFGLGSWIPIVHLVQQLLDLGFAPARAYGVLLWVAIGNVVLRVPANALADVIGRRHMWAASCVLFACADLALLAPAVAASYAALCAYGVLAGGCLGTCNSLMPAFTPDAVEAGEMSQAVSLAISAMGVGVSTGPAIAGALYDARGTYREAWVFAAVMLLAAAALLEASTLWALRAASEDRSGERACCRQARGTAADAESDGAEQ